MECRRLGIHTEPELGVFGTSRPYCSQRRAHHFIFIHPQIIPIFPPDNAPPGERFTVMASQSNLTRQQIQASNARIDPTSYPRTAVFVGGTSGVGEAAIQELVKVGAANQLPIRIYIIGRKESAERTNNSIDKLKAQNPHAELIFIQGNVSLLADVKRLCTEIKQKEKLLDLLFLSAGYSPMGGREGQTQLISKPSTSPYTPCLPQSPI